MSISYTPGPTSGPAGPQGPVGPVFTPYYGAFQDTTAQPVSAINTATPILFNTTDFSNGITIGTPKSRIVFANTGLYNVQWSGQFKNTGANVGDVSVWLRVNGTDVPGSAGKVLVGAKHGAINGHLIIGWNYFLQFNTGQYLELMWTSDDIEISIAPFSAISPVPATSSMILTAHQIG